MSFPSRSRATPVAHLPGGFSSSSLPPSLSRAGCATAFDTAAMRRTGG